MKWCKSTTLEFIKIYLKQECLWNRFHDAYKHKYKRENAYWIIISEFKEFTGKILSVAEVKNKIKYLRSTYSKQVHKISQKSSPDSTYEPPLFWFQEMDRCLKNIEKRGTWKQSVASYNYEKNDIPEVDSSSHSVWTDDPDLHNSSQDDADSDPLVSQALTDTKYDIGLPDELSSIVMKIESPLHQKRNKKRKLRHKSIQTYRIDSLTFDTEDEFAIYGKFIATQLRQLELNKALKVQLAIQNLLSEARLTEHAHT